MDSTHWYFAVHGNGYGPFTFEQLQQLARTEMISPSNFVWQQDETESRHVKDIDGLLRDFVPTQSPSRLRQAIWCGSTALIILGGFLAFHFFGDRFQMSEQSGNSEMAESASSQHSDQATEMAETSRSPQPSPLPPSQKSDSNPTNDESNALTSSEPEPPESNASLGKNPIETRVIDAPDKSNHPRKTSATIVAGNVALSSNGTVAIGAYRDEKNMLDGKMDRKYAKLGIGNPCVITLAETYQLSMIRFKVVNVGKRYYQYTLEVSPDGRSYEMIADRKKGQHRGWQTHNFQSRPVGFIRLTGTYVSDGAALYVHEFEAYCHTSGLRRR